MQNTQPKNPKQTNKKIQKMVSNDSSTLFFFFHYNVEIAHDIIIISLGNGRLLVNTSLFSDSKEGGPSFESNPCLSIASTVSYMYFISMQLIPCVI